MSPGVARTVVIVLAFILIVSFVLPLLFSGR